MCADTGDPLKRTGYDEVVCHNFWVIASSVGFHPHDAAIQPLMEVSWVSVCYINPHAIVNFFSVIHQRIIQLQDRTTVLLCVVMQHMLAVLRAGVVMCTVIILSAFITVQYVAVLTLNLL